MDVRCEKCGTEYELDESRLKPAGVSVKCTTCGHVFRVRRHPITSVGVGSDQPLPPGPRRPDTERDLPTLPSLDEDEAQADTQPVSDTIPIPTLTGAPTPGPRMVRMTPSSARSQARRSKERNWLVRLPSGEIETCRELATLHQWIIAGKVTRNSGISRTGKSWKRLGEIRELEPFFDVAEETRRARMGLSPEPAVTRPGAKTDARTDAKTDAKTDVKAGAKTEAQARVDAVLQARQMPRVIQPIPDSFSASGPVESGPGGAEADSGDAWDGPGTAESMPPELDAPERDAPEPPVLPPGASRPAGAGLAAGQGAAAGDGKRTLLGVPGGPTGSIPAYGTSFADDDDEGPTEEVDVMLAMATAPAPGGQAADAPDAGPDGDRPDFGSDADDDDDEPAPVPRAEDMPRNPLDHRLPRPSEPAPVGPGKRSAAADDVTVRSAPIGMGSTFRGPAPVPMAPPGRAGSTQGRADDAAFAATALAMPGPAASGPAASGPAASGPAVSGPAASGPEHPADRASGSPATGPAARLHAAAQDAATRRSTAAGQGAPGAPPAALSGRPDAALQDAFDEPARPAAGSASETGSGAGSRAGADSGSGAGSDLEGPRRLGRGLAHAVATEGQQGPSAGMARRSALQDVAFAGGKIRPLPEDGDETMDARPVGSSRAGRWIVVVALVLMAASAAVVYMLVFRPTDDAIDGLALGSDAGTGDPGAPDAGEAAETAKLAELVRTRLARDTQAGLEELDEQLQAAGGDAMLAARARVHTALAQHLFDGAALAGSDADKAGELERKGKALVLEALTLAQRALQHDRLDPDALVAMADVQRLQKRQSTQVESYLTQALGREPEHREARLVRALVLATSERTRKDARALLDALAGSAGGVDVRPMYRLALLDLAEGQSEDARRRASDVLAAEPAHEGARALVAHLDATPVVDPTDPMPVEETPTPAPEGNGRGAGGRDTGGRDSDDRDTDGGSYDDLVARADKRAKARDCREAMELYERALDDNPSGVSALLGMAECHVERKEFASAYGKLQAVLGVSPSHAEAMWRMAEAYRKQGGMNAQAVSWYRKYVEEHPSGPRASKARQRIDELGAGGSEGGGAGGSGSGGSGPGGGSTEPPAGGGSTEPPAGGGSTEPPAGQPAGQNDPPPAPGSGGGGDPPGSTAD
jgi:predicted Zn finger-like uncharacterized protein